MEQHEGPAETPGLLGFLRCRVTRADASEGGNVRQVARPLTRSGA
jgi:hypothetical protein